MTQECTRYEALKAKDGYWYVVRLRYFREAGGKTTLVSEITSGKMPRHEAEGTASKANGR